MLSLVSLPHPYPLPPALEVTESLAHELPAPSVFMWAPHPHGMACPLLLGTVTNYLFQCQSSDHYIQQ